MKQAVPYFGRFLSKLVLEIIPGALVSVAAAYLLSMLHLGAEPATAPSQSVSAVQNDGLSADERRELTRQMLKERRENPEEPAEVRPVPSMRPASLPSETADLHHDHGAAPPASAETKLHTETEVRPRTEPRPSTVATIAPPPTTPLPRPPAPRARADAAATPALPPPAVTPVVATPGAPTVTASLPPPVVVAPGAVPPPSALTPLPQVTVNAPASASPNAPGGELSTQPQQRGIVGNIFSGVSTIAGGAANITGNTVNWVIDLPGKAISAGGKLLTGKDSTAASGNAPGPGNATAAGNGAQGSAAPAAAPPPTPLPMIDPQRRNFL